MSKRRNDWLPLIDACRIAGIGYREAWQAVADGRVSAIRKGRRWLVKPTELVSAVQDQDPSVRLGDRSTAESVGERSSQ